MFHVLLLMFLLLIMMGCNNNSDNKVLVNALEKIEQSNQLGFKMTYDINLKGQNDLKYSMYTYAYHDPFYVTYSQNVDSEISRMVVKRDGELFLVQKHQDQYYQSTGPKMVEESASHDFFDLFKDATLVDTSIHLTYEKTIKASKLEDSNKMITSLDSYVTMHLLEKTDHDLKDIEVDVEIKVRKKGELHSILFDLTDYLNQAYAVNDTKYYEHGKIEYYYLPGPFTPTFDEDTPYIVDDHANFFYHQPVEVTIPASFSMSLQYFLDVDIVSFEIKHSQELTFEISGHTAEVTLYNQDYQYQRNLYRTETVQLDPGVYYIFVIGLDDLGDLNVTIE